MISNPKPGQLVQVWYREGLRDGMQRHGHVGTVVIVSKARKARNHMIDFGGGPDDRCAVPAGNLRNPPIERFLARFPEATR